MDTLHDDVMEYKKQLGIGTIKRAYRGLMDYMMDLKTHLKNSYPNYYVSGSMYPGYMDMTYFSFYPELIKQRNLKIAVVFLHESCRFEAWLAGANKQVQASTWKLFQEGGWDQYRLVPTTAGADSIIESVLADPPDFRDLPALTRQIEHGTLAFIRDVESFLAAHPNRL